MKAKSLTASIATVVASAFVASSAQAATLVAGWDFSQYFGSGLLSLDGSTFTDTLDANYSDLDPTFGAGSESATFGTMFMDGTNGSTNVDEASGSAAFQPVSGSLSSNLTAPINPFDSHTILSDEGQTFTNFLGMIAKSTVSVVFKADLTSVPQTAAQKWVVTFGGKTVSGTSTVGVDFSTDGSSYTSFGSVVLDSTDKLYSVTLGNATSDIGYVRLNFAPSGSDQPIIDNLDVMVPAMGLPALGPVGMLMLTAMLGGAGTLLSGRRQLFTAAS